MIQFRKSHRILRADLSGGAWGHPDISFHGVTPGHAQEFEPHEHYVGVLFAGTERDRSDLVYVAANAWWEELEVKLPGLPQDRNWTLAVSTWEETPFTPFPWNGSKFTIGPRSVMVFTAGD